MFSTAHTGQTGCLPALHYHHPAVSAHVPTLIIQQQQQPSPAADGQGLETMKQKKTIRA